MSPQNPLLCTPKEAQAAAAHLKDARLPVDRIYIPTVDSPIDGTNKYYLFRMVNGAHVCAALVVTTIRYNPSRWRQILTADINRAAEPGPFGGL